MDIMMKYTRRHHICDRFFTDEDNTRQPDGSSPCSYHPGQSPDHHSQFVHIINNAKLDRLANHDWENQSDMELLLENNELERPPVGSCSGPQVTWM